MTKRKRHMAHLSTTAVPRQHCPACTAPVEACTGIGIDDPKPARPFVGAWVLCWECGTINRFDEALTLRLATREELDASPALIRLLQAKVRQERPAPRRGLFQ